jgi:anti-sigma-K factor RskA
VKHERATEELREVAALYALGTLTQREAHSFEVHIQEGCPVCESECRKFQKTVAVIGLATEEATPPEYIRDLLSARIEREPQMNAAKSLPSPVPEEKMILPLPSRAPILSQPQGRHSNLFPWVLVAILVILGLGAVYAWKSSQDAAVQLETKLSSTQTDLQGLRTKMEGQKEDSGNLERVLRTVGKPGSRIARLIVQTTPPAFSAAVVWDTEKGECLLVGKLPAAPEGKVYQLWFFSPTAKISAGPFKPISTGLLTVSVPGEASNATAVVVTLEPDNGSQIPTSPYFAAGRID